MAPFSGDSVSAREHMTTDDNPAADAGSKDYPKDDFPMLSRAKLSLCKGEAVGVIRDKNLTAESAGDIPLQGPSIEAGCVGVL